MLSSEREVFSQFTRRSSQTALSARQPAFKQKRHLLFSPGDGVCLVLVASDVHPQYRLIIAGNRDETYDRPTSPLDFWHDHPGVLAGRDLKAGGTWLGVTLGGRFAAVTNYRDPSGAVPSARSRGDLVKDFLISKLSPVDFLDAVQPKADQYNGFNVLLGDTKTWLCFSNRNGKPFAPSKGLHGLSNHLINTPWPKVQTAKARMKKTLKYSGDALIDSLFSLLDSRSAPPDNQLPDTGVGLEWERILSPIFIVSPMYGTRSSSIVLFDRQGKVTFVEQTFEKGEKQGRPLQFSFPIEP